MKSTLVSITLILASVSGTNCFVSQLNLFKSSKFAFGKLFLSVIKLGENYFLAMFPEGEKTGKHSVSASKQNFSNFAASC